MNDDRATHLTPLRSLHNHRVAEGDPDVRGWDVFGADGKKIGQIDDLLVDTQELRVRYLNVTLDLEAAQEQGGAAAGTAGTADIAGAGTLSAASAMGGLAPMINEAVVRTTLSDEENRLTSEHHYGPGTRHVLIPIGKARLDQQRDRIVVEGLHSSAAAGLPDYDGQNLDREYETTLLRRFDQTYAPAPESDFYAHDLYDESRFYAPRRQRPAPDTGQTASQTAGQPTGQTAAASPARTAGLEPGGASTGASTGESTPRISGELDRAVDAPDHNVTRDDAEAVLPVRGRS
ncbi:MAG TPA: PRC-barrel domain-containing protein [Thermoanaerobaculia bacterium]|nr:PRC-barrel domain-containing protein [Thermoanaerobaculia bacterium]